MASRFDEVITEVQQSSTQSQRAERLIDGICRQMSQSGNQQTQQFGQELAQAKSQLMKSFQTTT